MPHDERASTSIILDNAYEYIQALQVRHHSCESNSPTVPHGLAKRSLVL